MREELSSIFFEVHYETLEFCYCLPAVFASTACHVPSSIYHPTQPRSCYASPFGRRRVKPKTSRSRVRQLQTSKLSKTEPRAKTNEPSTS
ncbi:hypothetical protein IC582_019411 [Cucumis melo]